MNKLASEIFNECKETCRITALEGNQEVAIKRLAPFEECGEGDLIFVAEEKLLSSALEKSPSAIVLSQKGYDKIEKPNSNIAFFISDNVALAHALIKQRYYDRDYTKSGFERIHPTAIVHESVNIDENTILGPYVVIEQGVKLGKNSVISSHVTIEHEAVIGDNFIVHPNSVIGHHCIIGKNCTMLSNSVIGSDGMGFSQDEDFNHHRIPQTGIVRIGDNVFIGAANTLDRATYGETVIGDGTIFDNICHTAHNVKIGKNCILLSGWLCAGSSVIGDRVIASGQTMLKDHVNVASDTIFVHRAGVIRDITEKGMYAGSPTQPMRQYTKNLSVHNKLGELAKEVKELKKKLDELQ